MASSFELLQKSAEVILSSTKQQVFCRECRGAVIVICAGEALISQVDGVVWEAAGLKTF